MNRLGLLIAMGLLGCNNFGVGKTIQTHCMEQTDCEDGNDNDLKACQEQYEYQRELARVYDCQNDQSALLACIISESSCEEVADEDVYTTYDLDDAEDQCEDEIEDYYECLDKGSSSLYDDYDSD